MQKKKPSRKLELPGTVTSSAADADDANNLWEQIKQTSKPLTQKRKAHSVVSSARRINRTRPATVTNNSSYNSMPATIANVVANQQQPGGARDGAKPKQANQASQHPVAIDGNSWQRLQRGRFQIDAYLDLHGMRVAAAEIATTQFIQYNHRRGNRTLKLITGKGNRSIYNACRNLLTRPELQAMVIAVSDAPRGMGGSGVLLIRLRRQRNR